MKPPVAKKISTASTHHQTRTLQDDYGWLRQDNWQAMFRDTALLKDDICAYLEAENAFTQTQLIDPHRALIDQLIAEMKARIEIDYDTAPVRDGPWLYYARLSAADYPVYLRRAADGRQPEQIILDVTAELKPADGHKIFLGDLAHSPDHAYLAIAVDYTGSEDHDIMIKDLRSGAMLPDRLRRADGIVWHPDSSKFYYTRMSDAPDAFRRDRVFCHVLGQEQSADTLIFASEDTGYFLATGEAGDRRFLTIALGNSAASEIHVLDMTRPDAGLVCLAPRSRGVLYDIVHTRGRFYIRTNADGAVEFKVMVVDEDAPQIGNWRDLVPHQPGRLIRDLAAFRDFLVRVDHDGGLPRLVVRDLDSEAEHGIAFDDPAYYAAMGNAAGFDSDWLQVVYSSPRMPTRHENYNMRTRESVIVRTETIAGHDPDAYIVERIFAPAADCAAIPVTVLRHKDIPLDGSAPLWLYGYGSYGSILHSHFSHFNPYRYMLAARGFIVADAHVRGGGDLGRQWYLDGKLGKKKNTFTDFIAAADYLVALDYTSPGRIAAEGRSAGGLLMGAVANLAPEGLFACLLADVPFVDVMNTILDASLPLTPPEWEEWGNPVTDAAAFDYMLSYSPYDNVTARAYPALFVSGGLTDPRVTYWEPAKWVARLRAHHTGTAPIYLHIAMDSGHGGDPGRFSHLPEQARELAFILSVIPPRVAK